MKSLRFVLSVVLMSLATVAFAQSDAHKMAEPKAPAPKSEAQTSFDAMKTLAGDWEGPVKTDMPVEAKVDIKPLHVSMRVTSRGNVLVHEFQEAGTPLEFEFADLSGSNAYGHMYHAVFTIIDSNHHTEDWTYMMPGDKPVHAHVDLQRAK